MAMQYSADLEHPATAEDTDLTQGVASVPAIAPFDEAVLPARDRNVTLQAFMHAVAKIESIIELETVTLLERKKTDFVDFNHRKSQGLLELSRTMRSLGADVGHTDAQAHLSRLRGKLEKNLFVLQNHLTAVREVAAIVTRAMEDDESDGTYSSLLPQEHAR